MFIACTDSPAETIYKPGRDGYHKIYFGSASAENKGERKHVEGFKRAVPGNRMSYSEKLLEIEEDLSSAISYAGGKDLRCFDTTDYGVVK